MKLHILLFMATLFFSCLASAQTPTPSPTPTLPYGITNLGESAAQDINDHGQIVGADGSGATLTLRGTTTNIGSLGYTAYSINNEGALVGRDNWAWPDYNFLWTPDEPNGVTGTPTAIGPRAVAINDAGVTAGYQAGTNGLDAFSRNAVGTVSILTLLSDGCCGGAFGINEAGDAVGYSYLPAGHYHPVLWSGTTPTDLGTLGGLAGEAAAINNAGDIVGWAQTTSGDDHAFLRIGTAMSDIGTLPGYYTSRATDLNETREVVGHSEYTDDPPQGPHAFVYTPLVGMIDLNSRIGTGTGWTLKSAAAINECGQIVGQGTLSGDDRAYLLTPPHAAMVYDPDPLTASGDAELEGVGNADSTLLTSVRRCVRLQGLYPTGMLDGQYATTNLTVSPVDRVEPIDGIFDYTRSETGFEEVMAYYHTDAVKRYLDELGFSTIQNRQVGIDASSSLLPTNFVSGYSSSTKGVYFKGRTGWIDTAEDPMSIWHENFHAILDNVRVGFGGDPAVDDTTFREAKAFNEGAADYWAASRFAGTGRPGHEHDWDVYVGRWVGNVVDSGFPTSPPTPRYLRRVDSVKVYPDDYLDQSGKIYTNGLIVSSALWSIRQLPNLGRARTDKLLIRSLQLLTSTSDRFRDAAKAFLAANEDYYSGADAAAIKTVLTNKGLYFEIASLSLDPTTVVGGLSVTGQVILTGKAPVGDAVVTLSTSHAAATVPATVTVLKGYTSATFPISTSAVGTLTSGDITATFDGKEVAANLDVTP